MPDLTALSHWFPKLKSAGLPVPETIILPMPQAAQQDVLSMFDGCDGGGNAAALFAEDIRKAANEIGWPVFLRTDYTSGKHSWQRTCFLTKESNVLHHIAALVEFSECCSLFGLPWDTWVVREFLPTIPFGECPEYGMMPICKEFRFFVDAGEVKCWHPYWPLDSLISGGASNTPYSDLCSTSDEGQLIELAKAAGNAVGGCWSVDILETKRGWYVTDMAVANQSWHWPGCVNTLR